VIVQPLYINGIFFFDVGTTKEKSVQQRRLLGSRCPTLDGGVLLGDSSPGGLRWSKMQKKMNSTGWLLI